MPYYYGYYGYGDFLANNLYFLLLIPVLLLSLWAQFQVSGSFRRYSQAATRRRFTGAMAAEAVLRFNGVYDVPIRPCRGNLTDHYDPRDNTIYLSEGVYNAPTIAAVGVAAHEAGHAVQYAAELRPCPGALRHHPRDPDRFQPVLYPAVYRVCSCTASPCFSSASCCFPSPPFSSW